MNKFNIPGNNLKITTGKSFELLTGYMSTLNKTYLILILGRTNKSHLKGHYLPKS
jgi:hypothetical protein